MKIKLLFFVIILSTISLTGLGQCTASTINSLWYTPTPACNGSSTTLNISGSLNDATKWKIYKDGCGVTPVDSTINPFFVLSPSITTKYYIRGEGGCVTPGTCDTITIKVVNLVVTAVVDSNITCRGDSTGGASVTTSGGIPPYYYYWSNGTYDSVITGVPAGTYVVTISDGNDCTKKDTVVITENIIENDTLSPVYFCQGDSAIVFSNYEKTAGFYYDTLSSSMLCDSIVVQELIERVPIQDTLSPIYNCQGDSTLVFSNYEKIPGYYTDTLSSTFGCDSILYVELKEKISTKDTLSPIYNCQGDSTLVFSNYEKMPGYYTDTLSSTFGCDSILYVELKEKISTKDTLSPIYNCQGDSTLVFSNYEKMPGYYTDTLSSTFGCDSILYVELIETPILRDTISPKYNCQDDSTLVFGKYQKTAGYYYDTVISSNSCDSIITQKLIQLVTLRDTISPVYTCPNEPTMVFGTSQTTPGYYSETTIGTNGCDSVTTRELKWYTIKKDTLAPEFTCAGDSVLVFGIYQKIAQFYSDTLPSTNGCDSILYQELKYYPTYNDTLSILSVCNNDSGFNFWNLPKHSRILFGYPSNN